MCLRRSNGSLGTRRCDHLWASRRVGRSTHRDSLRHAGAPRGADHVVARHCCWNIVACPRSEPPQAAMGGGPRFDWAFSWLGLRESTSDDERTITSYLELSHRTRPCNMHRAGTRQCQGGCVGRHNGNKVVNVFTPGSVWAVVRLFRAMPVLATLTHPAHRGK
jgi:hypothetical protein